MRDLIRREDAVDVLAYFDEKDPLGHTPQQIIMALPSVQPQRMRGKWETIEGWDGDVVYRCSKCGEEYVLIDGTPKENGYHFCPNCGSDMRGTE